MPQPRTPGLRRVTRDRSGVTMTEILIAVIIIGLIAAMAIPRMYNWVSTLSSGGAARQLQADIAYTRMMAVREGRTASLTLGSGNTYSIVVENTDQSVFRTLRTVRVNTSYPGTTLTGDAGNGRIAFDSRGILKSGSTSGLTLARGSRSQHLTISSVGRVIRDTPQ